MASGFVAVIVSVDAQYLTVAVVIRAAEMKRQDVIQLETVRIIDQAST